MKTLRISLVIIGFLATLYGCSPKYGCPAGAVGAENAETKHQPKYKPSLNKFQD